MGIGSTHLDDLSYVGGAAADEVGISSAFDGHVDNAYLQLGRGDNLFRASDQPFTGNVVVAAGDGSDVVDWLFVTVGRKLVADLGSGPDRFLLIEADVVESIVLNGGPGEDAFRIDGSAARMTIEGGDDADRILVEFFESPGSVYLSGGRAGDQIFVEPPTTVGRLQVAADIAGSTAPSDDIVRLNEATATDFVHIETAAGNDRIVVQDFKTQSGSVVVRAGRGNDEVLVNATDAAATSIAANLTVYGERDDDEILLAESGAGGVVVTGALTIRGDIGTDGLTSGTSRMVDTTTGIEAASQLTVADFMDIDDLVNDV